MKKEFDRKIVLEDGSEYFGYAFGDREIQNVSELVFDTAVVGYQEMISDPACAYQTVVMTYPVIGNYGIADEDFESRIISVSGLVVRDYNDSPSNFRYTKTLSEVLEENHVPGVSGVDTRKLARRIRDNGSLRALITFPQVSKEEALRIISETPSPKDVIASVSCKKKWYSRTSNHKFNVVAIDCGIKMSIIRNLNVRGCNVTVVPWNTPAEDIVKMSPDGIVVSNGPGDPAEAGQVISTVKTLRGKFPIFGICLGHLIVSLACGARTYKLRAGHHGGNHPVREIATGKIEISAQNHDYAVDPESLEGTSLKVTRVNVIDGTVEGVECVEDRIFCIQYHPESAPGPQDSAHVFDKFINMMKENANA